MVTIRQVARTAGVSIGTVSRALNNKPGVSEETRQHVLDVAQRLGYTPPKRVSISTSTVTHLGLLNRPMKEALPANPFYGEVFHGIEQVCQSFNINLSYSSLDIVNGRLRSLPTLVNDERISGLIPIGAIPRGAIESVMTSTQAPIVLVDNCFPQCSWDAVMTDNPHGASIATEFLISKGHRHIALLGGPEHPSIVERRAGYEGTMQKHELRPIVIPATNLELSDGEKAVVELLRRAPGTTGIVCSNDLQAMGALRTLQELGYKIPEDFSIVGFDDINLVQVTSPPLTTIRVDKRALGQVATQLLIGRISSPTRSAVKAIVSVTLVERASVGPPRARAITPPV